MADPLPLPPHWDPDRAAEVWRVDYAARFAEAANWREQQGLLPAAADRFRVALVVVDVQNTFCTPGFELFVADGPARVRWTTRAGCANSSTATCTA